LISIFMCLIVMPISAKLTKSFNKFWALVALNFVSGVILMDI
jgi:hypothetical protein